MLMEVGAKRRPISNRVSWERVFVTYILGRTLTILEKLHRAIRGRVESRWQGTQSTTKSLIVVLVIAAT